MAENPFEQYQISPNYRNESMQMRMMMNAERMSRMEMPRTRFAGGRGMGQDGMLGALMSQTNQPDYSQFTYDPQARAAASAYLGQYGLSPIAPEQVKQNAILPNTGFFGQHPNLSRGIEGALFGAAATRGSDTWGEGISNVARGMIEAPQMRQAMINRQFAAPFQAANMMEGMEDKAAMRRYRDAEIQHLEMENKRYDHIRNFFPIPAGTSSIGVEDPKSPLGFRQIENPYYDPKAGTIPDLDPTKRFFDTKTREFQAANPGKMPSSKDLDAWKEEWEAHGVKPPQPPKPQQELWQHSDGTIFELRPGYKLQAGDTALKQAEKQPNVQAAQKERWLASALKNDMLVMSITGELPDEKNSAAIAKKLGDYFDQNIAQTPGSPMPSDGTPVWDPTTRKLK